LARDYGVGLHTHLAETKIQALRGVERWGSSICARLASEGALGPHFVGGHSVWIDEHDIRLLATHGAMVAHNPASNLKLGSGLAPIREILDAGIPVGIGSDGSMSSDNQNMFEAMRFASLVSKVRFAHQPDRWVGSLDVLQACTLGGARLLGQPNDLGAVEVGRLADIVLLNANSIYLTPLNDIANALVYCETGASVDTVFVGGRMVVSEGRVLTVDEDQIKAKAREAVGRLVRTQAQSARLSDRIEPFLRAACATCAAQPLGAERYA
jgi:guanine deaminase